VKKAYLFMFLAVAFFGVASAQFVGSKNSNKYHKQECQWAQRISESNRIEFKSAEDAIAAGYQPCKVCSPPTSGVANTIAPSNKSVQKQSATGSRDGRCEAITKKGTRCSRKAQPGSRYCWQHQRN
jgi:methylphosphotriester-DNA--protein-cysteine methyltransferase